MIAIMNLKKCDKKLSEIERLRSENYYLKRKVLELEERLSYLEVHKTLAEGLRGERIISARVGGSLTAHKEGFDVLTTGNELLEIKVAKLNSPYKGAKGKRWAWGRVLGENNKKHYDYLILMGVADEVFRNRYRDCESPYVCFLVPFSEVIKLATPSGNSLSIFLSTNPLNTRSKASILFKEYQVTLDEIGERFGRNLSS